MEMLKYGMVGGGKGAFIGDAHRKSINLDGKARIVSGCFSRNWDNTLATGKKLGIDESRLYKGFEEMAKSEAGKIDFVVVATTNTSHFAISKAFLEEGIHVVCEKPVTCEVNQAEELIRLAKEKDLLFAVTYSYGGSVTFKHVCEIIAAGEIGEVRVVMGEYPQGWLYAGDGGKQGSWRIDPAESGASNALGDIGTHIENSVYAMTGLKIKRLLAKMDKIVPGRELDDNSTVLIEFENGAVGTYWASQVALGCDNDLKIRIFGSKGAIEWNHFTSEDVIVTGEDGIRKLLRRGYNAIAPNAAKYTRLPSAHTEGYFEALANIYSNFIDCLHKYKVGTLKPEDIEYPGLDEGLDGVKFIHKCIESSEKGNIWVDFE